MIAFRLAIISKDNISLEICRLHLLSGVVLLAAYLRGVPVELVGNSPVHLNVTRISS